MQCFRVRRHNDEVVSSNPAQCKILLRRKAMGNRFTTSTFLEIVSEPCIWLLLCPELNMRSSEESIVSLGVYCKRM